MSPQIRPNNGHSLWNARELGFQAVKIDGPAYGSHEWVQWNGRTWLRKSKHVTLCEVVGYQLADVLELPLQPWIAFYDEEAASEKTPDNCVGILVERWFSSRYETGLSRPAGEFPDLVARGLALAVFDRHEWPVWLVGNGEMRLIDLERIGPIVFWPPQRTSLRWYGRLTGAAYNEALGRAVEGGLADSFEEYLRRLVNLDFAQLLDLSGLPKVDLIERTIITGLELRQWELQRLLDGTLGPKPAQERSRSNCVPGRSNK